MLDHTIGHAMEPSAGHQPSCAVAKAVVGPAALCKTEVSFALQVPVLVAMLLPLLIH